MKPQPAVVVGLESNGLGVVRSLGRAGVPVIGLTSDPRQPTARSRYCRTLPCPDERSDAILERLVKIGKTLEGRPPLFLTMDRTVQIVSQNRERLEPYFRFNLPAKEDLQRLNDKQGFSAFALENGLRVPEAVYVASAGELDEVAKRLRFPLIVKPLEKGRDFDEFFGSRAITVSDEEMLKQRFTGFAWQCGTLVQEYVPGGPSDIHFCLLYLDEHSNPLCHFVGCKIRIWPLKTGNTASAEPADCPEILETAFTAFNKAGMRGICSLEFKRHTQTGDFFIIEPTIGRTDWQSEVAPANGINIPYVAYCDLLGLPVPGQQLQNEPVKWIDYVNDYRAAEAAIAAGTLSHSEYKYSMQRPRVFALFAWDDPIPRLSAIFKQVKAKARGVLFCVLDAIPALYPMFKKSIPADMRWPPQVITASLKRNEMPPSSFVQYFTRDPERRVPNGTDIMVSPADGVVRNIFERNGKKIIDISMNFYDVHVQRYPISGRVVSVEETGERVEAGSDDEQRYFQDPWSYEKDYLFPVQKVTTLDTAIGEVVIRQISSIWARRITTLAIPGNEVRIGDRMGDILFGSTVVLELPDSVELAVESRLKGRPRKRDDETIVAGETIVARFRLP